MTIVERCTEYLALGGLWNPDLMDHRRVSDLIADCRDELERNQRVLRQIEADGVTQPGTLSYSMAMLARGALKGDE